MGKGESHVPLIEIGAEPDVDPGTVMAKFRTKVPGENAGFNRLFLRRFARLWSIGFGGACSGMSWRFYGLMIGNLFCGFSAALLNILAGMVVGGLVSGSLSTTLIGFIILVVLGLIISAISVITQYKGEVLRLDWRRKLVENMQDKYFRGNTLYWLNNLDKSVDNCDQRMSEDLDLFTVIAGAILFSGYINPLSVFFLLANVVTSSVVVFGKVQSFIPIAGGFGFFVLSVIMTTLLLIPVVPASYRVNQSQGDFRFKHMRVKEYAEAISFYGGMDKERKEAESIFDSLYWRFRHFYKMQAFVTVWAGFQQLFSYAWSPFLVSLVIRPDLVINGVTLAPADIQATTGSLSAFISALCALPSIYAQVGSLAGIAHRICQLMEAMDALDEVGRSVHMEENVRNADELRLRNVTCRLITGRTLFREFTMHLPDGKSLIIMGPSGAGKSSLLRVVGGLWPLENGVVERPVTVGAKGVFFVPQRPYIMPGTLRDQIVYPHSREQCTASDADLIALLGDLKLDYLANTPQGLDREAAWQDMLSGGEQQRLGFARLLYHRPRIAIMDESTAALDIPLEHKCMELCQQAGITCVSVGHRPSLRHYHHLTLQLDGVGGMAVKPTPDGPGSAPALAALEAAERRREQEPVRTRDSRSTSVIAAEVDSHRMFKIPETKSVEDLALDRAFFRRFFLLFKTGFPAFISKPTMVLSFSIILGLVVQAIQVFALSLVGVVFYNMTSKNWVGVDVVVIELAILIAVYAVTSSACSWMGNVLALYWYRAVIEDAHAIYFEGKVAYAANQMAPDLDNIDQRICADSLLMTTTFGTIIFGSGSGTSIIQLSFGIVLSIVAAAHNLGAVGACVVYAILCIIITNVLMKPITSWIYKKNHWEGTFRFAHARIREFSESVAFYSGQTKEHARCQNAFLTLYDTWRMLLWKELPVNAFNNFTRLMNGFVAFAFYFVALLISGFGPQNAGNIISVVGIITAMLSSLMALPGYLTSMASVAGYAHRVGELLDTMTVIQKAYRVFDEKELIRDAPVVAVDHVTVYTPQGNCLYRDLTFTVRKGESLIIMGPSGSGKSSLLRVLGGLWPFDSGVLRRPAKVGRGGCFFVPQRSYLIDGNTLRDQVTYPESADSNAADNRIVELLRAVRLDFLLDREGGLDAVADWSNMLSGGEMQRVGFARLLYHRPAYAFMDEATSALDVDLETKCMTMCMEAEITCVSVAHRPTLERFHKHKLMLDGAGGFTITDASHEDQSHLVHDEE